MTKLVEMKQTKAERKDSMPTAVSADDGPSYPYGLNLRLDNASLEKLGLKSLPKVGAKLMVHAVGVVTSVSQHESKNHDDRSVEIQLQKLCVESEASAPKIEDTLRKEYRKLTGGKA